MLTRDKIFYKIADKTLLSNVCTIESHSMANAVIKDRKIHCLLKNHPLLFSCISVEKITNLNENLKQNS